MKPSIIYLNNAATAWPKAPGVAESVAADLAALPFHSSRSSSEQSCCGDQCRELLAAMLGNVPANRIVFTSNATQALNLAILGIGLGRGNRVVSSVTEHNSVLRPLAYLEDRVGIETSLVPIGKNGMLEPAAWQSALALKPRLVVLNHASNVTGVIQPIASLFQQAHAVGAITLLDASQTFGHLPCLAKDLHADLIALTGHKGLRGPAGTGALYVKGGIELDQILVGGTGVRSDLRLHPMEMPMRLEAGTPNYSGLAGLQAALRWHQQHGGEFQRQAALRMTQLREGLRPIPRVRLFGDCPGSQAVEVVSFQLEGWSVAEAGYVLAESFGILCRTGLHCAPLIHAELGCNPEGTIRLSPSGANTETEIAQTLAAIARLAG